jgi:hypothetical protein
MSVQHVYPPPNDALGSPFSTVSRQDIFGATVCLNQTPLQIQITKFISSSASVHWHSVLRVVDRLAAKLGEHHASFVEYAIL